mgnify:CR=1 FL=1
MLLFVMDIKPKIVRIKVNLKSDAELTLISHLITITPGTLVIDVEDANDEGSYLFVHFSYHCAADETSIEKIEKSIKKFMKQSKSSNSQIQQVSKPPMYG